MIIVQDRSDAVKILTHMEQNSLGEFNVFVATKGQELMTKEFYDQNLAKFLSEFLNQ